MTLFKIASTWVTIPIIAVFISFISLFFLQNVFDQQVYKPVETTSITSQQPYDRAFHV